VPPSDSNQVNATPLCDRAFQVGRDTVNKLLPLVFKPIGQNGNYKKAQLFFFCKALKTYGAVRTLQNAGYMEDARVLARSIFEIRLQARYMGEKPSEHSKLFYHHKPRADFHAMKKFAASGKIKALRFEKDPPPRIGRGTDWWGKGGVHELAKKLGLEAEYDFEYWNLSELGHTQSTQMFRYVSDAPGKIVLSYLPEKVDDFSTIYNATRWLFEIVSCVVTALEVDFDNELLKAAESLIEISKRPSPKITSD
jgi:hypothetical protein